MSSSHFCISTPHHTLCPPSNSTPDKTNKETTGGFFDSENTPTPVQSGWPTFSPAQPCTWEEVERHAAKLDTEEAAAKEEQDIEEVEEDPDMEIPNEEPLDTNMTEITSHPSELKAGLPEDFSGNSEDSNRWMLFFQAYFEMNSSIYNNKAKLLTALNKMSKGRGKPFSEGWFYKLNDATIPDSEKTWDKMVASFKTTFYPFDIQNKARTMNRLVQNLRDHEKGFQKYVADFQLATAQTGIKDEETLIKAFATELDPSLGQMVLSVKDIPTTLNKWIRQASKFHAQQKRITALQEGGSIRSFLPRTTWDPNAMDIDVICLSPIERAEYMKHNKCFICHKVGCHTKNYLWDWPHNQEPSCPPRNPSWVRATTTTPATTPTSKPKSELAQFVGSLEKKGTTKEKILQILTICFTEEDKGKVEMVATTKVEEVEDF